MRICMVSNLYPPYVLGGAELYVQQIAKKLSAKHDISIITTAPFGTDNASVSNLEVKGKETIYRFYPLNLYSAYNYALKPTFILSLIHISEPTRRTPISYAVFCLKKKKKKKKNQKKKKKKKNNKKKKKKKKKKT